MGSDSGNNVNGEHGRHVHADSRCGYGNRPSGGQHRVEEVASDQLDSIYILPPPSYESLFGQQADLPSYDSIHVCVHKEMVLQR